MPGLIDTTDGTGLMEGIGDIPEPTGEMLDFGVEANSMYLAVVI